MSETHRLREHGFPNKISRILLLAVRDTLGDNPSEAVLTTARLAHLIGVVPPSNFEPGLSFAEVGRLFEAVEGIHGVRGGHRLARQAGRASFRYWVEGLEGVMGFADVVFRILPLSIRVRIGIEVLAEIFNRYSDQGVSLRESTDRVFFVLEPCGFCHRRRAETPACAFPLGILEEMLFWVSLGRRFAIEETTCIACGDPVCTFAIDKVPTDRSE